MRTVLFSALAACMLLYCQQSATINDVNTGSIYGKVVSEKDTLKGEVVVELFKGDTVPAGRSATDTAIARVTTKNLEYDFDDLGEGVYSLRALKNGTAIGKNESIRLGAGEKKNVTIIVVIIINQTFIMNTDNSQNVTINNFYVNNQTVAPDPSGKYPATFPALDTLPIVVEYVKNGVTYKLQAWLIKKPDGTYWIKMIDDVAPVLIVISPDTSAGVVPGRIIGYVARKNGTSAAGARVIIRNKNALFGSGNAGTCPANGLKRCDTTITTAAGAFSFDSVDTGNYFIEVNDRDSAGALAQGVITKANPVCSKQTIILAGFGTIMGRVPYPLMNGDSAAIFITALDRLLPVGKKRFFIDERVPKATYAIRLVSGHKFVASSLDSIPLKVEPGDTAIPAGFELNSAPAFTTKPSDMLDSARIGNVYKDTVHAIDPDRDTLTFAVIDSLPGMTMTDSIIQWTPGVKDTGSHAIAVLVKDDWGGVDTLAWRIRVNKAIVNKPPAFTSLPADMRDTVTAGSAYLDTVRATDPDGDAVAFAFLDSAAGMTLGGATGIVSWTPAASDTGNKTVRVRASDGKGGLDTLAWTIRVNKAIVNKPPAFTSLTADMRDSVTAGSAYLDTVRATDPDGDAVAFAFLDSAAGMALGGATGIVLWIPGLSDTGNKTVRVRASDGKGGLDTLAWTIRVNEPPVNRPPAFSSLPADMRDTVTAGSAYLDTVRATDPDGDAVAFAFLDSAAGMALGGATGIVSWTPGPSDTGNKTVRVRASDGKGGSDTLAWTIYVKPAPVNHPPVFTSQPADMRDTVTVGTVYLDTVHAADVDGDAITYSFKDSVAGMQLKLGIITWTPVSKDTGTKAVSVIASDTKGAMDTLAWNITARFSGLHTVPTPAAPSGAQNGEPGKKYGFITTPVKCSYNDPVQYRYSWGNGAFGAWKASHIDSVAWPNFGIYKVQVQARCSIDTTVVSDTSAGFLVGILNSANGTLFNDCEGDTGLQLNRFGGYCYVFDDSLNPGDPINKGNSKVLNAGTPPYYLGFKFTQNEGNPFGSGSACAKMVYKFGTNLPYPNFVGIGGDLVKDTTYTIIDNVPKNLSGLTAITFWAKASAPTQICFEIKTTDIADYCYYMDTMTVTSVWQKYEIPVNSLTQPDWGKPAALHLDQAWGINWQVRRVAPNSLEGTLWIDDVYFQGYTWKP